MLFFSSLSLPLSPILDEHLEVKLCGLKSFLSNLLHTFQSNESCFRSSHSLCAHHVFRLMHCGENNMLYAICGPMLVSPRLNVAYPYILICMRFECLWCNRHIISETNEMDPKWRSSREERRKKYPQPHRLTPVNYLHIPMKYRKLLCNRDALQEIYLKLSIMSKKIATTTTTPQHVNLEFCAMTITMRATFIFLSIFLPVYVYIWFSLNRPKNVRCMWMYTSAKPQQYQHRSQPLEIRIEVTIPPTD